MGLQEDDDNRKIICDARLKAVCPYVFSLLAYH
jgi:hypothetical protein